MIKYAPKIFANNPENITHEILDKYSKRALEIALYGYKEFPLSIKEKIIKINEKSKIIHLWQKKVSLIGLLDEDPETIASLNYENLIAKELNVKNVVLHINHSLTDAIEIPFHDPILLAKRCFEKRSLLEKFNLVFNLENIHENIYFFNVLFDRLSSYNMQDMFGFTLDTGHARVYSKTNLDHWLILVGKLKSKGFNIHYHIHLNDGTEDQHISLSEAHSNDTLDEEVKGWAESNFLNFLNKAIEITPEAIFCQEHPSFIAPEAISFIEMLIEDKKLPHSKIR